MMMYRVPRGRCLMSRGTLVLQCGHWKLSTMMVMLQTYCRSEADMDKPLHVVLRTFRASSAFECSKHRQTVCLATRIPQSGLVRYPRRLV